MHAKGSFLMLLDFIGVVATVSSIISLPPQVLHTYKKKSADDLSMLMLINFLICSYVNFFRLDDWT